MARGQKVGKVRGRKIGKIKLNNQQWEIHSNEYQSVSKNKVNIVICQYAEIKKDINITLGKKAMGKPVY